MITRLLNKSEILKALAKVIERRAVFEVRALDAQLCGSGRTGTVSGYFDNADACFSELEKLIIAKGIYFTLNPVNAALLARRANRLDYAEKNATTNDQHILQRRWLLLDVDAQRPSGISASDSEKEAAHKKALEIHDYLKGRGWPLPMAADSGNGYHLLYRIDLPCDDGKVLEQVLTALADRFDGGGVKLDRTVFNPSRIARLHGTLAAKGDNTKERPHRLSKILKAPDMLQIVSVEKLLALVEELQPAEPPPVERPAAHGGGFDVEAFLTRYGVAVAERMTRPDGTVKWRLERCVFNPEHETPDAAVFQFLDGKLGYKCFHNSCVDKHWKDFRRLFEPDYDYDKAGYQSGAAAPGAGSEGEPLAPPPPYVPPPLDLLPPLVQQYIRAAAEALDVDISFILLPMLGSLGAAIGNSRSIILKRGFIQPPVIWAGIIGRSGSRKSPALEAGCLGVMKRERELMQQNKQAEELYADELAEWEGKKGKGRGQKPDKPTFLTGVLDDLTIEVLADALVDNPRGILVRKDELSHWLASFDQYRKGVKGSDVARWLTLHSAFFFGLDRRTDQRHYRIHNPRACLTGGIQPKVLQRILTEDFFERGLPARFLFAHPPGRRGEWSEATVPEDLQRAVLDLFEELWLLPPDHDEHGQARPKLLRLDADAKAVFVAFYNECGAASVEAGEHQEAAWCKLAGHAARLGLVGQLARDPFAEIITGDTMRAACGLARWFGNEAVRIYAELAETPEQREQRELVEFIERHGGTVTEREVYTNYSAFKNEPVETKAALAKLVSAGRGEWIETRGARGPATREFQLLPPSASAGFPISPSKERKSADADTFDSQENEAPPGPDADPPHPSDKTGTINSVDSVSGHQGVTEKSGVPIKGDLSGVGRL